MLTKKREAEYRKKTEKLIKKIDFEKDYHNITTTSLYRKNKPRQRLNNLPYVRQLVKGVSKV